MAFSFPPRSKRPAQRSELFEKMAERMPSHDQALASSVKQLAAAYRSLIERQARLERDQTITPGRRLVELAKFAHSNVGRQLEALNAQLSSMGERKAMLGAEIEKAFNVPNKSFELVLRHQEIRSLFRKMTQGESLAALERARTTNDTDTLLAVAEYQPFLSGLPPQMHEHTRTALIEATSPEHAKALAAIIEQEEFVTGFKNELAQSVADMVNFSAAQEIMDAARMDAAE